MSAPNPVREEPLPDDERNAIQVLVPVGYSLIGVAEGEDAEAIGVALEATIARLSDAPPENPQQTAVALGAVYGDAVCRITGWEWVRITREDSAPVLAVASDDRSVCTEPIDVVLDRLAAGTDGHLTGFLWRWSAAWCSTPSRGSTAPSRSGSVVGGRRNAVLFWCVGVASLGGSVTRPVVTRSWDRPPRGGTMRV